MNLYCELETFSGFTAARLTWTEAFLFSEVKAMQGTQLLGGTENVTCTLGQLHKSRKEVY